MALSIRRIAAIAVQQKTKRIPPCRCREMFDPLAFKEFRFDLTAMNCDCAV